MNLCRFIQVEGYACYEDDDHAYTVMERLVGQELFERLRGTWVVDETWPRLIMRQILEAIAYLAGVGVTHRDIKCENIMLVGADQVKLYDFGGCALDLREEGLVRAGRVGSLGYLAPEVLRNHYNAKCDVWSAGVIMYIVYAARFPYSTESKEAFRASLDNRVFFEPGWDPLGLSLAKKLLDKDVATKE